MNDDKKNNIEQSSILIVEDDHDLRLMMSSIFHSENYSVLEAVNGNNAFSMYERFSPDLIITDINMPEMNGIELIGKIRGLNLHLPIFAMSGEEDNLQPAEAAGANQTFLKPFDIFDVLNSIGFILSK